MVRKKKWTRLLFYVLLFSLFACYLLFNRNRFLVDLSSALASSSGNGNAWMRVRVNRTFTQGQQHFVKTSALRPFVSAEEQHQPTPITTPLLSTTPYDLVTGSNGSHQLVTNISNNISKSRNASLINSFISPSLSSNRNSEVVRRINSHTKDPLATDKISRLSKNNTSNISSTSKPLTECKPFYSIAFVKTHKCASDTLAANFMRLAEEHNLEMPLPTGQWNLKWPDYPGNFYKSRKLSRKFDMTALHMMYVPHIWDTLMEPGYKSISVVRNPYKQFKSFFNYFGIAKKLKRDFGIPFESSFDKFLSHPIKYYMTYNSKIYKNPMLFDFGFRNDIDQPDMFVQKLAEKFSLVMISDHFDESLLVLRHEFCLPMRDIITGIKNKSKKYLFQTKSDLSEREEQVLEAAREMKYKKWSDGDYVLFETFNKTLWTKIAKIPKFDQLLADYRYVSYRTQKHCFVTSNLINGIVLTIEPNEFHEKIVIDLNFCETFRLPVIKFIDRLKRKRFTLNSPKYSGHFYEPALYHYNSRSAT